MVAAAQMSPRGNALARTFAAAFSALSEHAKLYTGEAVVLAGQVAAHLRSAFPMEAITAGEPTEPEIVEDLSELGKLRAEVEAMRPVFVAAIAWRESMGASGSHGDNGLIAAVDALEGASRG